MLKSYNLKYYRHEQKHYDDPAYGSGTASFKLHGRKSEHYNHDASAASDRRAPGAPTATASSPTTDGTAAAHAATSTAAAIHSAAPAREAQPEHEAAATEH